MDIEPTMLLLAALFFSAAAGMSYLMLKITEKLAVIKIFCYIFLPTMHLYLSQQLLKCTESRGVLTLQVMQELPTHALLM